MMQKRRGAIAGLLPALMAALGMAPRVVEREKAKASGAVIRVQGLRPDGPRGGHLGPPPWSKRLKAKRMRARKAGR